MPEKKKEFIYVCSAYGGRDENYKRALFYGRYVVSKGYIPILPHTMYHGILDDRVPDERQRGLEAGKELIKMCSAVWVFGSEGRETPGMRGEVEYAECIGVPVKHIKDSFSINSEAEKISIVLKEYESIMGRMVNRAICDSVVFYLNEGMSEELILEAMRAAAKKHAYWNYAEAILGRCLAQGIRTLEEFKGEKRKAPSGDNFAAYDLDAFEQMINRKD